MSSLSIGSLFRWCACGILFSTLVYQQSQNVLISLERKTSSSSAAPPKQYAVRKQHWNVGSETSPSPSSSSSSWMGNYWIPPPDQPLYSGLDFQLSFPSHLSVLMIGDSWLRYSYAMLHAILNNTRHPDNIRVVTLQGAVEHALYNESSQCFDKSWTHCWGLPSSSIIDEPYSYDFVRADCLGQAVGVLESAMKLDQYKIIMLGVGSGCSEMPNGDNRSALRLSLLRILSSNKEISVIWRTTPNLVEAAKRGSAWEAVLKEDHTNLNQEIGNTIQELVTVGVLDWAATLRPKAQLRTLPVPQNLVPPTSQVAQLALLQQLLHYMKMRQAQDKPTAEVEFR